MTAALPASALRGRALAPAPAPQPHAVPVPRVASLRCGSGPPSQPGTHLRQLNLPSQAVPPSFPLRPRCARAWGAGAGYPRPGGCHQGLRDLQCPGWAGATAVVLWQLARGSSDPWVALSSVRGLALPQHEPLQPRIYLERCQDQK